MSGRDPQPIFDLLEREERGMFSLFICGIGGTGTAPRTQGASRHREAVAVFVSCGGGTGTALRTQGHQLL